MRHHLFKSGVGRLPSRSRTAAVTAGALVALGLTPVMVSPAQGAVAPVGQSFTVTKSDLSFILAQIKIAERHAATLTPDNPCGTMVGTGADQIPSPLVSKGLRTVDGSCNNLQPGQETFGAADQVVPPDRLEVLQGRGGAFPLRGRRPRRRTPRSRGTSSTPSRARSAT